MHILLGSRLEPLQYSAPRHGGDEHWFGMCRIGYRYAPEPWNLNVELEVTEAAPRLLVSEPMMKILDQESANPYVPITLGRHQGLKAEPAPLYTRSFGDPRRPKVAEYIMSAATARELSPFNPDGSLRGDLGFKPIGVLKETDPDTRTGQLLRIEARDRTIVYQVGEYRLDAQAWELAWAD